MAVGWVIWPAKGRTRCSTHPALADPSGLRPSHRDSGRCKFNSVRGAAHCLDGHQRYAENNHGSVRSDGAPQPRQLNLAILGMDSITLAHWHFRPLSYLELG